MFFVPPQYTTMAERSESRSAVHIPIVYEQGSQEPIGWEYHVLVVDPREEQLPSASRLNDLGNEGWILSSLLDERATGRGNSIHYYFTRQKR